jgi:hypothetical protein
MTTHLLIPPAIGSKITINGRVYDPAAGAQNIPDFDAAVLEANGWSIEAQSVTTTTRPVNPTVGMKVYDTTVAHTIIWNGKAWVDETNTAR